MKFSKFTNGLIMIFFVLSIVGLWVSITAFERHSYFRMTMIFEIITVVFMLGAILLYVLKKDDGLLVWSFGFTCIGWVFFDVIWVLVNGFNLVEANDTMNVTQIEHSLLYYMLPVMAILLSVPLAKAISKRIGKNQSDKSMQSDKSKQALTSMITLIVVVAIPIVLKYFATNYALVHKYILMVFGVLCLTLLQSLGFAFLLYKRRITRNKQA